MQDLDELDRLRNMKPGHVLRSLWVLRSRLESPGSTSGLVARRLAEGLATREPYQGGGGDLQRAELTWLLGFTRDLTDLEDRCCRIRYGGTGEQEPYKRIRQGKPVVGDAEEELPKFKQVDWHGKPLGDAWSHVRGTRERMPTYAEVGTALGLTAGQAQWALNRAHDKVGAALKLRVRQVEELRAAVELVGPGKDSDGDAKRYEVT